MAKSSTAKLNNGTEIPLLGLGTYARGGSRHEECRLAVEAALEAGYRHIDTAAFYDNEEEVGLGIRNKVADGTVKREEVFLATKLWNDRHDYDKVVPSLKESLKRFGLTYVDLYLIHWPVGLKEDGSYSDVDYLETWKGMEECLRLGLTRSIGVSNFNIAQLTRLLAACSVQPVTNQIEMNPNLCQRELLEFCKKKGVLVTAYSPFGSMPEAKTSETSPAPRLDDPTLVAIGKKYGKNTAQVVLRFLLDQGVCVIPKSVTPARIAQNIDVFDFHLTEDEMKKIQAFDKNYRVVAVPFWKDHQHFPF